MILDQSRILLNASTAEITKRLEFVRLDEGQPALYAEQTIHGRWGVRPNTSDEESPLDMELLFNAAVTNPDTIQLLFNTATK